MFLNVVRIEEVHLYTTRCVINELELAGSSAALALDYALKFCTIIETAGGSSSISSSERLTNFLSKF